LFRHPQHLKDADPTTRVQELMMVGGPLYRSIARLVVATDRKNSSGSSGAHPRGTRQGWPDPAWPL